MDELGSGIIVGVLGQWASGKTEAARTLIKYLGGEGSAVFLTDRVLFASQAIEHILGLEDSKVAVTMEEDGRRRLDSELVSIWLSPGEELRTVDPGPLNFDVHDDQILIAWRHRAKIQLGSQLLERAREGKPVVLETAFGPNQEAAEEQQYGRTIPDLFERLENSGVEPNRVKWIIVEAGFEKRLQRNAKRHDNIPVGYFAQFGADGGDLTPGQQKKLEEQGTSIKRVNNNHDDIEVFRADIIAAFEEMFGRVVMCQERYHPRAK